jgi:hypothetical protein
MIRLSIKGVIILIAISGAQKFNDMVQFDVNELLAVYGEMLEADRRNGTDFAREQAEYIKAHYPLVELSI